MRYYYEVSVAVEPVAPNKVNPFHLGGKVHWVRKGKPRATFAEAQRDAITNGERPYRIESEPGNVVEAGKIDQPMEVVK